MRGIPKTPTLQHDNINRGGDGNRPSLNNRGSRGKEIKFIQINSHHRKTAMAVLCQKLVDKHFFRNLVYKGQSKGLNFSKGAIFSVVK
jgi:hypothetical protein